MTNLGRGHSLSLSCHRRLQSRAGAATAAAEAAALSAGAAKTVALNDELDFKGHAKLFFG
jgi:hypothetical protein